MKLFKDKEKCIDHIVDFNKNLNGVREPKPISKATHVLAIFLIIRVCVSVFYKIDFDSIDDRCIELIENMFTILVSFVTLYISIHNDKRKDFLTARKNAYMLSEILESVYYQIENISRGNLTIISYPQTWIDYYNQCSIYLKYSYFDELMFEFSTVDKINHCIENNDIDKVKALVARRNLRLTDSQSDFDILRIRLNLSLFSQNSKEEKTWKQEKIYVEFDKYIKDNYTSIIKELTIKYLNNHGGTCDSTDVEYFIINELRKNSELTTGPYKYTVMENKAVLKAIRKIYYSLTDEDAFFLCWGELSLR